MRGVYTTVDAEPPRVGRPTIEHPVIVFPETLRPDCAAYDRASYDGTSYSILPTFASPTLVSSTIASPKIPTIAPSSVTIRLSNKDFVNRFNQLNNKEEVLIYCTDCSLTWELVQF